MPDKTVLLELLRRSGAAFPESFRGVTPKQFHAKPAPDRWSIAETAEHVTIVELGSGRFIRTKLTETAPSADDLVAAAGAEARIEATLGTQGKPFPSPERVLPKGRWSTAEEMIAVFEENRAATIDFLESCPLDLTQYVGPHPRFGPLNGLDWAYFLVLHGDRHLRQIEGIKTSPAYPR